MSVERIKSMEKFEQNCSHDVKRIATLAINASRLTEEFAKVDRIPRYADGRRESDVEHSFMLAIAAPEIVSELQLDLDIDTVRRFALVHDMLEIEVGDVATFDLTPEETAEKELRELQAKEKLLDRLPSITRQDLETYELQDTREAVFVRMVDKLLPVAVDITGQGERVVIEDYGVKSYDDLVKSHIKLHGKIREKFGNDFPDLVDAHRLLCGMFEFKYMQSEANNDLSDLRERRIRGPVEVERKFRIELEKLSEHIDLSQYRSTELKQGYLAIGIDGSETRVRSVGNERFELTVKSPGMIERKEQTSEISPEMFDGLYAQTKNRRVEKTRYYIPLDSLTIELDIYHGKLEGLATVEVEFEGRTADAAVKSAGFQPPEWFGEDVSESPLYKNHHLAQKGMPHKPLVMGSKNF